jgi:hypothetical protein
MPPLPPGMGAQSPTPPGAGGAAPMPSMMQLTGMQQPNPAMGGMGQTPGMSQISEAAVRMGAEIDQALKLLAQSIPQLAPWVEKTCLELRYQIGSSLNSGAVPTDPTMKDNEQFPDGGGRI